METITTPPHWGTGLEPDLECFFRGSLYAHHHVTLHVSHSDHVSREMRALFHSQPVRSIRKFIISILYLALLTSPVSAFPSQKMDQPTIEVLEHMNSITVRTSGCKPLTAEELKARMGIAFDDSIMRIDDVTGDDVNKNDSAKSANSVIEKKNLGRDSNEAYLENYFNDESQIDNVDGSKKDIGDTVSVQSKKFMRRKRTASDIEDDVLDDDVDEDYENTNTLSDTRFLYQNMLFETTSKQNSRKRRSASGNTEFHPAWECEWKRLWKKMKNDVFPKVILDGHCSQKSCFFGLYRCKPKKYPIKLLKRDPTNACNPVPTVGDSTTYEEKWEIVDYSATVACECGLKGSSGRKNRKDRKRKKGRDE